MKKIYIILTALLFTITLVVSSCTEEEKLVGYPYQQENVFETITATVTTPTPINAEGRDLDITITLPRSFSSNATLEVTGTLKSGVQSIVDTITLPAGSSSVDTKLPIPVDDPDSAFEGIPDFFSVQTTGLLLEGLEPGINYIISSEPLTVDLYNTFQLDDVDGSMTYLMDWANPSINDFDVYVADLEVPENSIEVSATGNRYESDIFNNTHPDGTYTIDVVPYTVSEETVPWKIFFVYPDQESFEIFEGTFTNAVEGETYPLVQFTKTTDPNTEEVTYTNVSAL